MDSGGVRKYTTESGSVYTLDFEEKTWVRQRGENASELRTDGGSFFDYEITAEGLVLFCPPLQSIKGLIRIIESTPIVKVEVINDSKLSINGQPSDDLNRV